MGSAFLLFFFAGKKEQKGRAHSIVSRRALFVWNLLFGSLPFVSNFVLRISDVLTAADQSLINEPLH